MITWWNLRLLKVILVHFILLMVEFIVGKIYNYNWYEWMGMNAE